LKKIVFLLHNIQTNKKIICPNILKSILLIQI
jgi:hypothetical protein